MATELKLIVNGLERVVTVDEPASLAAVLVALELKPDRIAVEHNGRIARRAAWGETPVQAHDKLEIVHFVGGGCGEPCRPAKQIATGTRAAHLTVYVLSDVDTWCGQAAGPASC